MTKRGKIVLGVLVCVCAVALGLYVSPTAVGKVEQVLSARQADSAPAAKGSAAHAVSVATALATTADFPIRRYAIGFIASPAVVNISARVSSQVVSIAVKDGQMVKAGDLLISLDDRALKAQVERDKATLAKDQALLASAEADLARAKDLVAKQAGTAQAYDQALAAQKAAAATIDADQAAIDADMVQLGFTKITAPISGRLGAVSITVGDLVSTNSGSGQTTPLVTITQMDPLQAGFNLPESDLALLQKTLASPQQASVTLHHDGDPKPIGTGKLDFVDSSVDIASGTIAARATVPNADLSLWPGQYVGVVLDAGTVPQIVSVPTVAVQPSQKGSFVYVVKDDDTVEMRPVKVALSVGANSAVAEGLKSGERVVVDGQTRLKNGTPVHEGKASAEKAADAAPAAAAASGAAQ